MKIWDLIEIDQDERYSYFLSRDNRFKGKIKIDLPLVPHFMEDIKTGNVNLKYWQERLV